MTSLRETWSIPTMTSRGDQVVGHRKQATRNFGLGLPSMPIRVILECIGPPFSGYGSRGSMNQRLNHPSTISNGEPNIYLFQLPLQYLAVRAEDVNRTVWMPRGPLPEAVLRVQEHFSFSKQELSSRASRQNAFFFSPYELLISMMIALSSFEREYRYQQEIGLLVHQKNWGMLIRYA